MEEMNRLTWSKPSPTKCPGLIRQPDKKNSPFILLLLPTTENKLLARWQGAYTVLRKMGLATCEIKAPGKRKPQQTVHVKGLSGPCSQVSSIGYRLWWRRRRIQRMAAMQPPGSFPPGSPSRGSFNRLFQPDCSMRPSVM